jgi:hypothetical protein
MQDFADAKTALADAAQRAGDAEQSATSALAAAADLQKQVDTAYAREKALATDNAKMKPVYDEVRGYWGLGAIFYGIKELLKHLIIAAIVVVILIVLIIIGSVVLQIVFPWLIPIFRGIGAAFGIAVEFLKSLIDRLKPKPTPTPPPPTPLPPAISVSS